MRLPIPSTALALVLAAGCGDADDAAAPDTPPIDVGVADTAAAEKAEAPENGGLFVRVSANPFDVTLDRIESGVAAEGFTIVDRVDHAAGARAAGLELEPSTVVLLADPAAGTPLVAAEPTTAIDLPLKILVYEDRGIVRVGYNRGGYLAWRHGLEPDSLAGLEERLGRIVDAAVKPAR